MNDKIPCLNKDKEAGQLINFDNDLSFEVEKLSGLTYDQIFEIQTKQHVLATSKKAGDTLLLEDFRKAKIGVVVVCRMDSNRLPSKAILKIGKYTSIERCIKSVLRFPHVHTTVLATSTNNEDAVLKDHCYRNDVKFYRGDSLDVMKRILEASNIYELDILSRVTGDMPFASAEIYEFMLKNHFETGVDYSKPGNSSVGTSMAVFTKMSLEKLKTYFPAAEFSEYLPYYFTNNPEVVDTRIVELPEEYIRGYRLTLDFEDDLIMLDKIETYLEEKMAEANLNLIFNYLDNNPEVSEINSHHQLKYTSNQELIDKLNKHTRILNT